MTELTRSRADFLRVSNTDHPSPRSRICLELSLQNQGHRKAGMTSLAAHSSRSR